jgi:hypothetical protein
MTHWKEVGGCFVGYGTGFVVRLLLELQEKLWCKLAVQVRADGWLNV